MAHPDLAGVPMAVFANKQDLPHACKLEEIEEVLHINSGATSERGYQRQQKLLAVSALTCAGVENGIQWLVDCVASDPEALISRTRPR